MEEGPIYREIISRILSSQANSLDIQQIKLEVCRKYGISAVPKHSQILSAASPAERRLLRSCLRVKPTRTLSGVAPVAVMTSPYPCPHGRCLPCPGGPNHPFQSPQSYTGEEPAARRAREHEFDPFRQVTARLEQFQLLGHHVGKAELIVMGGTMTARPPEYQEMFVSRCLQAMNEFGGHSDGEGRSMEVLARENEQAAIRCIGITFETRPDWCGRTEIDRMLALGVTKVELGVQHTLDRILEENRRGCATIDTITANRLLRNSGLKVGFHVMPNLPGSSLEADRAMFRALFDDPSFRPDFLKIYPTLVTPHSEIEALWERGAYAPYPEEDLIDLIADAKSLLPRYVRLQRIQRDIPARLITAGSRHSNFRQLARTRLEVQARKCSCIRCREVGRREPGEEPEFQELVYDCCDGREYFFSFESGEALIGFARLRLPEDTDRPEVSGAALLRELHVYGELVPIGETPPRDAWQHRRFGEELLRKVEEQAGREGYRAIAVMSGIGVRPYYRRHGYEQTGPYMKKVLV